MHIEAEIEGRGARRYPLANAAELILVPGYVTPGEAASLRAECERLPWEHQRIRGVPTRRANAWLADDPGAVYRYSGQVWTPTAMPEPLRHLGARLGRTAGEEFNCALATSYPTGEATVGYHADNEPVFGRNPVIASVSLGATRVFGVVHRSQAKGEEPGARPDPRARRWGARHHAGHLPARVPPRAAAGVCARRLALQPVVPPLPEPVTQGAWSFGTPGNERARRPLASEGEGPRARPDPRARRAAAAAKRVCTFTEPASANGFLRGHAPRRAAEWECVLEGRRVASCAR
jgi:alkylated DNA repair dioxygenase AlkB